MAEPTYEELKAKVAELEKKGSGRRTGALEYRVGEKGGVSVYGLGRFRSRFITSSGYDCWTPRRTCAHFWMRTRPKAS